MKYKIITLTSVLFNIICICFFIYYKYSNNTPISQNISIKRYDIEYDDCKFESENTKKLLNDTGFFLPMPCRLIKLDTINYIGSITYFYNHFELVEKKILVDKKHVLHVLYKHDTISKYYICKYRLDVLDVKNGNVTFFSYGHPDCHW